MIGCPLPGPGRLPSVEQQGRIATRQNDPLHMHKDPLRRRDTWIRYARTAQGSVTDARQRDLSHMRNRHLRVAHARHACAVTSQPDRTGRLGQRARRKLAQPASGISNRPPSGPRPISDPPQGGDRLQKGGHDSAELWRCCITMTQGRELGAVSLIGVDSARDPRRPRLTEVNQADEMAAFRSHFGAH